MPVEDHPKWTIWSAAFDKRNEAERLYREAQMRHDPAIGAAKLDFEKAQAAYDAIVADLD